MLGGVSPTASTKTLTVIRHSKAEPSAATDHARPLAPKGLRDAQAAGQWLAARPMPPVVGLVSTAVRARQTWETVAAGIDSETRALDGLYDAGVDEVIETLHLLDEPATDVVLVGHNPTMERLVHELSDGQTPAHAAMVDRGFPTTAIAMLRHDGRWPDLTPGTCPLTDFHVARA
jgi:phosphohistidine phosphatase